MSAKGPTLCPSGKCEEGAKLLGIVQSDSKIGYLGEPLEVDQDFVDRAHAGRIPERRFRFATPCAQSACRQWTGSRCGVIDHVLRDLEPGTQEASLPKCGIRSHCRWFGQSGPSACGACSLVITDTRDVAYSADGGKAAGKVSDAA